MPRATRSSGDAKAAKECQNVIDKIIEELEQREIIVDDGEPNALPREGLCWVRLRADAGHRTALWPAWLLARAKAPQFEGWIDEDDDGSTRLVCCYGDGAFVRAALVDVLPLSATATLMPPGGEGALWTSHDAADPRAAGPLYREARSNHRIIIS
jgi:hypothetical protein